MQDALSGALLAVTLGDYSRRYTTRTSLAAGRPLT